MLQKRREKKKKKRREEFPVVVLRGNSKQGEDVLVCLRAYTPITLAVIQI